MKQKIKIGLIVMGGVLLLFVGFVLSCFMVPQPSPLSEPPLPNPNAFDIFIKAQKQIVNSQDVDSLYDPTSASAWTLAEKKAIIADNQAALVTFRSGLACEYAYPFAAHEFQSNDALQSLARLVEAEGRVAAEEREWNRAVNAYIDTIQLGVEIPRRRGTIAEPVGERVEGKGRNSLLEAMEHLTATDSRAALVRLEALQAKRVPYADLLRYEWYCKQSLFQKLPKRTLENITKVRPGESPVSLGRLQYSSQLLYTIFIRERILRNLRDESRVSIANTKKPFSERTRIQTKEPENSSAKRDEEGHLNFLTNLTYDAFLRTRLALHAYRWEHKGYPSNLDELVTSGYLKSVPGDPFQNNSPLHYHQDGRKYLLYSVGPDGKDDKGKLIDNPNAANEKQRHLVMIESKGDIRAKFRP